MKARKVSLASNPVHKAKVAELNSKIEVAKADVAKHQDEENARKAAATVAEGHEKNQLRDLKLARARRDVARANCNLGIRDSVAPASQKTLDDAFSKEEKIVAEMEINYAELKKATVDAKNRVSEITGKRDEAEKELKAQQTNIGLIHAAINKIEPDNWLSSGKRKLMLTEPRRD